MIALLLVYLIALAAASRLATRLAGGSWLHAVGLTLMLFMGGLSSAAAYAGLVGQLHPSGMMLAALFLSAAAWLVAGKAASLPDVPAAAGIHPSRGVRFALLIAQGAILAAAAAMIARQLGRPPVSSSDAAWQYVPNVINLVQAGTLHHLEGISAYMPLGFEIIFAWEIAFARSLLLVPIWQSAALIVGLIYAILIADLAVRDFSPAVRSISKISAAALWLGSQTVYDAFSGTGKNDLFYIVCGLAATYYLLCHISIARDLRLAGLIGFFSGAAVASKLSGAPWIVVLGLIYVPGARRSPGWQRLLPDATAAAAACALVIIPWALRIVLQADAVADQAEVITVGSANTILRQWGADVFQPGVVRWLLPVALLIIGQGLLLWWRPGAPWRVRLLPAVLVVFGTLLVLDPQFDRHLGGFYGILAAAAITLTTAAIRRQRVPSVVAVLMTLVGAQMLLLTIVPYSAWIDEWAWSGEIFFGINYRYAGAAVPLFGIAQVVLLAHVLTKSAPNAAAPSHRVSWRVPSAVLAVLMAVIGARLLFGQMDYIITPLGLQEWLSELPAPAQMYAINVPPLSLYGSGLGNRVQYVAPGHHGYFGDQAYRWDELQGLIEAEDLDYIAVTFAYPVFIQSRLLPTPEVLAEIDKLREHLTVVYEDPVVTVFATRSP